MGELNNGRVLLLDVGDSYGSFRCESVQVLMRCDVESLSKSLFAELKRAFLHFRQHQCGLCGERKTSLRTAYGRVFAECPLCGLISVKDLNQKLSGNGMGLEGSWSGPGGGGYREYFLTQMLITGLNKKSFLLFGTGNTPTFERLLTEGVEVVGCDVCQEVVRIKVGKHGSGFFFEPQDLPLKKKYDGIIAVEVFEHFTEPSKTLSLLVSRLNPGGIICGTTDFYCGGSITDSNRPGYMSHSDHCSYWSARSMAFAATKHGLKAIAFELIRPGSVLPDERYGQLWPNKRVFFIYDPRFHEDYFRSLHETTPILPIDRP
jgi:SAM-dependent methyltransferase